MAFARAVQNEIPEAFEKYIQAKFVFSEESKVFHKARKLYKNDPLNKFKWYEARERYSIACKNYHALEDEYIRAQAIYALEKKGLDVSSLSLKNLAQIDVATNAKDVMDQVRRENEQTLILLDPKARKLIEEMKTPEYASMRQQFMDEMDESKDVTLDDSPLVEQQAPVIVDAKEKITEIDEDGFKITFKEKDPTDGDFNF